MPMPRCTSDVCWRRAHLDRVADGLLFKSAWGSERCTSTAAQHSDDLKPHDHGPQALTAALGSTSAKAQWNAAAAAARVFGAAGGPVAATELGVGALVAEQLPQLLAACATALQHSTNSKAQMQVRLSNRQQSFADKLAGGFGW